MKSYVIPTHLLTSKPSHGLHTNAYTMSKLTNKETDVLDKIMRHSIPFIKTCSHQDRQAFERIHRKLVHNV